MEPSYEGNLTESEENTVFHDDYVLIDVSSEDLACFPEYECTDIAIINSHPIPNLVEDLSSSEKSSHNYQADTHPQTPVQIEPNKPDALESGLEQAPNPVVSTYLKQT